MATVAREQNAKMEGRLQEALLVMDVVDELRHRQDELSKLAANDDGQLKDRLAQIYRSQGIEVTDAILEQGIRDQRAKRYAYVAPTGPMVVLARLWINRVRVAKLSVITVGALAALVMAYQLIIVMPQERRIAAQIAALNETIVQAPSSLQAMQQALEKAGKALSEASAKALSDPQADRLKAIVAGAQGRAEQAVARASSLFPRFDRPAPALLTRETFEQGQPSVQTRVHEIQTDSQAITDAIDVVLASTKTVRTALETSLSIDGANAAALKASLPEPMEVTRAGLFATAVSSLTAGNINESQKAVAGISGLVGAAAKIAGLRQSAADLLAAGLKTGPDAEAAAALDRAHKAMIAAIDRVITDGNTQALKGADKAGDDLSALVGTLSGEYEYRIVSRDGIRSGVWRYSNDSPGSKNFYLVIEAVDGSGSAASLPILNEEDGHTEMVDLFAVRVPESEYERVKADKMDNGLIEQPLIGNKKRGALKPLFRIPVVGGFITRW